MYVPLFLTVHVCATFVVLAYLAIHSPVAFRGVRAAILLMAILAAWSAPLVAVFLIVPVVAATEFSFVRVPDVLDLAALYGNSSAHLWS